MTKYTLGYNHDKVFVRMIPAMRKYLSEVYFPAPYSIMSSGRAVKHEKDYEKTIEEIIRVCKENKLESNVVLNPTCEGEDAGDKAHADKIISYLKKLKKLGVTSVTITNPIHIARIKKEVPGLKIHSSVNCYVKNVEHARYLADLGVDVITVDRDINRDIELIRKIRKATGKKIKVLLNEGCLKNCPYRHVHFNLISHGKDTDYFDEKSCINIYKKYPEKVFQIPFIRPEDVKQYKGVADYFKLATRTTPIAKIPLVISAYAAEEYKGNLIHILSTKGLFGHFRSIDNNVLNEKNFNVKLWNCNNECENCSFCKDLLEKSVSTVANR